MPVGEDIINASPHIQDKPAFIEGINKISDELGISRDYLPIIMVTETGIDGTINPAAKNDYCGGLIQFCNGPNAGAAEVGVDAHTIASMSAMDQLPLIRQYLSTKGIAKGQDLVTTYLAILYPAAMDASRGERLENTIPEQAPHLYGPGGSLSKETIEAGLLGKAKVSGSSIGGASAIAGDSKFTPLPNKAGSNGSSNSPASLGTNGGAIIIGTYTRDCTKTPPWDWTMQGGKIYRGCALRITTLGVQGGQSSTPMYGAVSSSSTTKAKLTNAVMGKGVVPPKAGSILNPVPGVPLTSPFGMRTHPIYGTQKMHAGIDLAAEEGTPILAALDGVVSEKGLSGSLTSGYGYYIAVKHNDGSVSETFYAHLRELPDIAVGTPVKAGQVIASMGTTGGSTGPHLHFEVKDAGGNVIDPESVMQK
jgi:hypothetical protein